MSNYKLPPLATCFQFRSAYNNSLKRAAVVLLNTFNDETLLVHYGCIITGSYLPAAMSAVASRQMASVGVAHPELSQNAISLF